MNIMAKNKDSNRSKLKALRESQGLTQKEVSQRAEIGSRTLWAWEHKEALPSLSNLGKLAIGLGLPLNKILSAFEIDMAGVPDDLPDEVLELLIELPELLKSVEDKTGNELTNTKVKLARLRTQEILKAQNRVY